MVTHNAGSLDVGAQPSLNFYENLHVGVAEGLKFIQYNYTILIVL